MGTKATDRIDVKGDGRIILYQRDGLKDPKWQTRIRVPNSTGYKIVTTKTADLQEAVRFAINLYEELYMHVMAGGSIQSKTFKQVFEEWKRHATTMGHTNPGGSWEDTIKRIETYALKFFGNQRINAIGEKEFTEYWAWRKANYRKTHPTSNTLRRERTCLLPVFKYALSNGYIPHMPTTNAPKGSKERRPTFSLEEWKAIQRVIKDWVERGRTIGVWRERYVAQHAFILLRYTGLRVGELRCLRWCDVWPVKGPQGNYHAGHASGKTGSRDFVFHPGSEACINLLYDFRCTELKKLHPDREDPVPPPTDLIICHPDGSKIMDMGKSFRSLLRFAQIPIKKDGANRTIYSLRHLYATLALSNETSPFLLGRQMGTSVDMLDKYYGQTVTKSLARQITKSDPANLDFSGLSKRLF